MAGTMNASRQVISAAMPPSSGASEMPPAWTPANVPTARPRSRGGTASASPASSTGEVNALAVPWMPRQTRNTSIPGARAAPIEPTA